MMARRDVSRPVSRTETGRKGKGKGEPENGAQTGRKPPRSLRPAPITWQTARCEATGMGWHVVIPVPTSGNRIWRHGKGRTYEAGQHRLDKQEAALRFGRCGRIAGDVSIRVVWVRKAKRGDTDNHAIKPVLDILKGVLFEDDSQVSEIHAIRSDDQTKAPGCYVWVCSASANVEAA